MAQRYTHPLSLKRMEKGECPECGAKPDMHDDNPYFWLRASECSLLPHGVEERIQQYLDDKESE